MIKVYNVIRAISNAAGVIGIQRGRGGRLEPRSVKFIITPVTFNEPREDPRIRISLARARFPWNRPIRKRAEGKNAERRRSRLGRSGLEEQGGRKGREEVGCTKAHCDADIRTVWKGESKHPAVRRTGCTRRDVFIADFERLYGDVVFCRSSSFLVPVLVFVVVAGSRVRACILNERRAPVE